MFNFSLDASCVTLDVSFGTVVNTSVPPYTVLYDHLHYFLVVIRGV